MNLFTVHGSVSLGKLVPCRVRTLIHPNNLQLFLELASIVWLLQLRVVEQRAVVERHCEQVLLYKPVLHASRHLHSFGQEQEDRHTDPRARAH